MRIVLFLLVAMLSVLSTSFARDRNEFSREHAQLLRELDLAMEGLRAARHKLRSKIRYANGHQLNRLQRIRENLSVEKETYLGSLRNLTSVVYDSSMKISTIADRIRIPRYEEIVRFYTVIPLNMRGATNYLYKKGVYPPTPIDQIQVGDIVEVNFTGEGNLNWAGHCDMAIGTIHGNKVVKRMFRADPSRELGFDLNVEVDRSTARSQRVIMFRAKYSGTLASISNWPTDGRAVSFSGRILRFRHVNHRRPSNDK